MINRMSINRISINRTICYFHDITNNYLIFAKLPFVLVVKSKSQENLMTELINSYSVV